jgi:hypothetical protein
MITWTCPKCGSDNVDLEWFEHFQTMCVDCNRCGFLWWSNEHPEWVLTPAPQPDADTLRKLWRVATAAQMYLHGTRASVMDDIEYRGKLHDALDALHGETPPKMAKCRCATVEVDVPIDDDDTGGPPQPHSVTDEINAFIANEGKGDVRDALNIALNRLNIAHEASRIQGERHDADTALAEAVRAMPPEASLCHGHSSWWIRHEGRCGDECDTPEAALGIASGGKEERIASH